MPYVVRGSRKVWIVKVVLALLLFSAGAGATRSVFAQDSKPDPAGTATGDKSAVVDAAGNAFVVTEPTDKTAPDYVASKKAFDDYQAQAAKEPLAQKVAENVGHLLISTNFSW
jgi:hypothetical protein